MARPVVLILAGFYLPGYKAGGPVQSIANLVAALGDEFDFRVVAYDRDLGDQRPYDTAAYGEWQSSGKAHVWWVQPREHAGKAVRQAISESKHDLLYLNSFFDPVFGFGALNSKGPVLLAPRGQFGLGAMRIGALKKNALIRLLSFKGALRSPCWHATDDSEVEDILRVVPEAKREAIYLAPNLAQPPPDSLPLKSGKLKNELRICFLSRISPKKNLAGAIRIVSKLIGRVTFTIYGPMEDEAYGKNCLTALGKMPYNVLATYAGPLPHEKVRDALSVNDLLLLPTLGENFGHAIYESLSVGMPAVIGDRTPWLDLVARKAGCDLPVEEEDRFVRAIQSFVSMDAIEFENWRQGAWHEARSYSSHSNASSAHRAMFEALLGSKLLGSQP